MQNEMVSIPSANMNGGLKAANSSSGTVVGVGVAGTTQRVYLTPSSSYHLAAARQSAVGVGSSSGSVSAATATGSVGVVSTARVANNNNSNSSSSVGNTSASTSAVGGGTVRYFSQFSKLQPVQQLSATSVGQRNGTMLLVNGNKPLIFATPTTNNNNNSNNNNNNNNNINTNNNNSSNTNNNNGKLLATTTVPNGNRVLINKQQQLQQQQQQLQLQQLKQQQQLQLKQQQQQQLPTVIDDQIDADDLIEEQHDDDDEDEDDDIEIKQEQEQQQQQQHDQQHDQQQQPLALTTNTAAALKTNDIDAEPELDIVINNVVCSFSVRCHLKLREIALNGSNVEYRRENGMVTMKLRRPYTTASIWSSGRITCTGATSESQAKIAARRYARCLNKLGFPTHFQNFRIVNVLGTCSMPWAIKIVNFSERHRDNASYEPELHPGVTYKMREPKATLKIFSTGSITVTAASVNDVESAIQHIYPLVHEFRKQRSAEELQHLRQKQRAQAGITDEASELEQLAADAKNAAAKKEESNVSVNPIAVQMLNAIRTGGGGVAGLTGAVGAGPVLIGTYKQSYTEQTQLDRRQMPFAVAANSKMINNTSNNNTSNTSINNNNSSSSGDNICANARRRATECWASKLQNKRPRYNDPSALAAAAATTATTTAAAAATATTTTAATNVVRSSNNSNHNVVNVVGGSFITVNKYRQQQQQKPLLPVDVVLKQSSSRARNAAAAAFSATTTTTTTLLTTIAARTTTAATTAAATTAAATTTDDAAMCMKQRDTFSPTDFHVDDLIEEDDDEDIDMQF